MRRRTTTALRATAAAVLLAPLALVTSAGPAAADDVTPPRGQYSIKGTPSVLWFSKDVTVTWTWTDDVGIDPANCDSSTLVTESGTVVAHCKDLAGNVGTASVDIGIDRIAPTITATVTPTVPDGLNGWYRTAPLIDYTCADDGPAGSVSGVAFCMPDGLAGDSRFGIRGDARDVAYNTASVVVPIKVDTVPPVVKIPLKINPIGAQYPDCSITDAGSTPAYCNVSARKTSDPNYRIAVATGGDRAGNVTVVEKKFRYTTTAAFISPPTSVTARTRFSLTMSSKNVNGTLINVSFVRTRVPVKVTSTGVGPASTTWGPYATRIATGKYRVYLTAPSTRGYYRYVVRVGNADVTRIIKVV